MGSKISDCITKNEKNSNTKSNSNTKYPKQIPCAKVTYDDVKNCKNSFRDSYFSVISINNNKKISIVPKLKAVTQSKLLQKRIFFNSIMVWFIFYIMHIYNNSFKLNLLKLLQFLLFIGYLKSVF